MNKTVLATAIALAFGLAAPAWANPTNTVDQDFGAYDPVTDSASNPNGAGPSQSISQEATATSDQSNISGAAANEYSTAEQDVDNNKSSGGDRDNSGDATVKDDSDHGAAANNLSTATVNHTSTETSISATTDLWGERLVKELRNLRRTGILRVSPGLPTRKNRAAPPE